MLLDENTIDYALDRHAGFRREAERYRPSPGSTGNVMNGGYETRQCIRRMADLMNNTEIKINGRQEMIRIRIDAR